MKDAIVRRQNESGQEYFANQGNIVQKGVEVLLESKTFHLKNEIFSSFKFRFSGSFYDFKFRNYKQLENDFSGNEVTGVPDTTVNSLFNFVFFKKLSVDYSHYYISKVPLNDANSVWSKPSLVSNIRLGFPIQIDKAKLNLHLQVQNLYNTDYVAGFDINAFGSRFYNPAAKRNFILGANVEF
jgi:iron complex outermembrane receptor protein